MDLFAFDRASMSLLAPPFDTSVPTSGIAYVLPGLFRFRDVLVVIPLPNSVQSASGPSRGR